MKWLACLIKYRKRTIAGAFWRKMHREQRPGCRDGFSLVVFRPTKVWITQTVINDRIPADNYAIWTRGGKKDPLLHCGNSPITQISPLRDFAWPTVMHVVAVPTSRQSRCVKGWHGSLPSCVLVTCGVRQFRVQQVNTGHWLSIYWRVKRV